MNGLLTYRHRRHKHNTKQSFEIDYDYFFSDIYSEYVYRGIYLILSSNYFKSFPSCSFIKCESVSFFSFFSWILKKYKFADYKRGFFCEL